MNGLWKKRVPAFLLTLVMIVSLMPAALADETTCPNATDGVHTWGPCSSEGAGGHKQVCSACNAEISSSHSYGDAVTEDATCTKDGSVKKTCTSCS